MNNFKNSLMRFAKNKNTVTIVGIVIILVVLYTGYKSQIDSAVREVRVPVAASTIQPRTEITMDMITEIGVPSIAVTEGVYTNSNAVVGKYSAVNTLIPAGSMFYMGALIKKEDLPDSAFIEVGDGEIPYMFSVSLETTYGNSIYPGNKIDIYMKAEDSDGKVMVGKLLADVEVIAVKDSSGKNVFENTDEQRQPAYLIFGLTEEIHILLRKAAFMNTNSVELFPVPHGGVVSSTGETRVSTEYLQNFINANTVVLEGQDGTTTESEAEKESNG